jgi:hypothetical protein
MLRNATCCLAAHRLKNTGFLQQHSRMYSDPCSQPPVNSNCIFKIADVNISQRPFRHLALGSYLTEIETDVACNIRINASELSNRISEAPDSNLCCIIGYLKIFHVFGQSYQANGTRKYLQATSTVPSPAWIGNLPYTIHPPISLVSKLCSWYSDYR